MKKKKEKFLVRRRLKLEKRNLLVSFLLLDDPLTSDHCHYTYKNYTEADYSVFVSFHKNEKLLPKNLDYSEKL